MPLILGVPIVVWIIGVGAVSLATYVWSLSVPTGTLSWDNIVRWIDTNIRAVIDWAFGNIKKQFAPLLNGLGALVQAWGAVIDFITVLPTKLKGVGDTVLKSVVDSFIKPLQAAVDALKTVIIAALTSRVGVLETWRRAVADYIHGTIEKNIADAVSTIKTLVKAVTVTIPAQIAKTVTDIANITKLLAKTVTHLDALESFLKGELKRIIELVIPGAISGVISKIDALAKYISTTLDPMFNWLKSIKDKIEQLLKDLKDLAEELLDDTLNSDFTDYVGMYGWLMLEITKTYTPLIPEIFEEFTKNFDLKGGE